MTKTATKSPADIYVTGGLMQSVAIINACRREYAPLLLHTAGALDAPEWIPDGASNQWGQILIPRELF